jgi:hypothetical protein
MKDHSFFVNIKEMNWGGHVVLAAYPFIMKNVVNL